MMSRKKIKTLCYVSGILLIAIGLFHGSGTVLLSDKVDASNVSQMIKSVFPILFVLPVVEHIGLGIMCFLLPNIGSGVYKITYVIVSMVMINVLFALYLNALIPAIVLLLPAGLLLWVALSLRRMD